MQDRPSAGELLDAVASFLQSEVAPDLDSRRRFHARVAANVLGIVRREWELAPSQLALQREMLSGLLFRGGLPPSRRRAKPVATTPPVARQGDPHELWAQLAAQIRAGVFDDRHGELMAVLRVITAQKLAIANPEYPSSGR